MTHSPRALRRHPSRLRDASARLRMGVVGALVAGSSLAVVAGTATAPPASAAPGDPLPCRGALYLTDSASGNVFSVNPDTAAVNPTVVYDATPSGGAPNQLGVGKGGLVAVSATAADVVRFRPAASTPISTVTKQTSSNANAVAGAVNPLTGIYYYGGYDAAGTTLTLFAHNPAGTTSVGPVATVSVKDAPGGNGDLAFDAAGRLYFVNASSPSGGQSNSTSALYRATGEVPTTVQSPVPNLTSTELIRTTGLPAASNGIAFASDGYLYLGRSTTFTKVNPITGAAVAGGGGTFSGVPGLSSTDFGSCANPSTVSVGVDLPDGRITDGDQFQVTASGNDYDGTPAFPTGTTSGDGGGAQNGAGEVAGPGIVLPGQTYTAELTGVGSTDVSTYAVSYECRDEVTGALIQSGQGAQASVPVPTAGTGSSIDCAFAVAKPVPGISLEKSVSPTSFTSAGQVLTYTFDVANTGNTALGDFSLIDTMPGLSTPTCSPIARGASLPVGGTTRCTATYTVTQADIATGADKTNDASVTGTPGPKQGAAPSSSDSVTSSYAAVPPKATDDTATTQFGNPATLAGATNDTASGATIVPGSVVFTSPDAGTNGKVKTTPQGTWTVNDDGTVTFTPADGYSGTTPAVEYRVTDSNGLTDTGTLTVTVRPGPQAQADTATTAQDQDVTISPLVNDTPSRTTNGNPGNFVAATLVFDADNVPAGSTLSDDGKTLTVRGQGVYTIGTDGTVVFDPVPTLTGPASPVGYSVTDQAGNTVSSTIRVTVTAVAPAANDDAASTAFGNPVTLPAGNDDTAGPGGAIDPARTVLTAADPGTDGRTQTTPQGVWQVLPDGSVRFTPAPGFSGTTPAVEYRITDANGQTDTADLQVTVRPGPSNVPDSADTKQNVNVTLTPFANDTPSREADGTAGSFVASSVVLTVTDDLPPGSAVTDRGKTLTVPGEGVYTVDPTTGAVTFDPAPSFTGTTSAVTYEVTDDNGNVSGSTITIDVAPITPQANDDGVKTPAGTPITFSPLDNDVAGDSTAPLVAGSVVFTSPDPGSDGTIKTVPGQGVWEVNPDGTITFTPEPGFEGTTTPPVEYQVTDANGETDTATIVVVVGEAPLASPDAAGTPQNTPVTFDPLANDVAGDEGDPCTDYPANTQPAGCDSGTFDAGSVVFPTTDGLPDGSSIADGGTTLTVPGEGVYTIGGNGEITFTPTPSFTGETTPVTYEVTDSYGNGATGTVTVTVAAVVPVANDDAATTPFATPVLLDGATDDTAGDAMGGTPAPIVLGATRFPTAGQPAAAEVSDDGLTLTVPREGVYEVVTTGADAGKVRFTPADGFSGPTTPVRYRIEDANGTRDTAMLSVTVQPGPESEDDQDDTAQNVDVTVDVLGNDTPGVEADGTGGSFVTGSLVLDGADAGSDGTVLTVPGEGVFTVNPDGTITFDPEPAFTGDTTPITYTVTDDSGNDVSAELTIAVAPIDPVANDDAATVVFGTASVTLPGATDDDAGAASAPLVPGSTVLTDADPGSDGTTQTTSEGVWQVNPDGTITFTPDAGFSGTTSPVEYQVVDANGTTDTALLTVTVQPGPDAVDDAQSTPQNVDVTVAVLGNDTPGLNADGSPATFDAGSVVLTGADAGSDGTVLTVPGEGVYTVNPDGTITFDPEPSFAGTATPVEYTVTDSLGNPTSALLTITVGAVSPSAANDRATTPHHTPVLVPVLANDTPGSAAAPLDPTTLRLLDPGTGDEVTRVVVPGEGVWTVVDGEVRFAPERGFSGRVTPLDYVVSDVNGTQVQATVRITVGPAGEAQPDQDTTPQETPVTVDVLDNDAAAPGEELVPGSVCLLVGTAAGRAADGAERSDRAACVDTVTIDGVGTWTANPDGTVTFDPAPGYTGAATIDYVVRDTDGNVYQSTLDVEVTPSGTAPGTDQPGTDQPGTDQPDDGGLGLPNTGGPAMALLAGGVGVLLAGLALMVAGRRRRAGHRA